MPCVNTGCVTRTTEQARAHFILQFREQLLLLDQTSEVINREIFGQVPNLETLRQEMTKHIDIHKELWFIACSIRRIGDPTEYNPSIEIMQGDFLYMLVYPDSAALDMSNDAWFASE
jgi:hypothetical protein